MQAARGGGGAKREALASPQARCRARFAQPPYALSFMPPALPARRQRFNKIMDKAKAWFDSPERWFDSPERKALAPQRDKAQKITRQFIVEGK
jgi:hypothetical protein